VTDCVEGVVLAGGLGTRMGRDKAGLELAGEALYVRAARRLSAAGCSRVVVISRSDLAPHPVVDGFWRDLHGGQGPLDGLLTALENSSASVISVLGVDLPKVTAESLRATREIIETTSDVDAVVLKSDGGRQALASSWRRDRVLDAARNFFSSGGRSIHRFLEVLVVHELDVADDVLVNVNTPEQLAALESE